MRLENVAAMCERHPSEVHGGRKDGKGIRTPDFDWNVFVARLNDTIEQEKVDNDPISICRKMRAYLAADLTYDNRSRVSAWLGL